jgi:Lon protease-like protein
MTPADAPFLLPLFPLPNVVHFPDTELPLHIFEPRYRALVRDLEAQREAGEPGLVGMVLSQPGERTAEGRTAFYPAGTAARLVAVEPLPDGRCDIVLRGEYRFTTLREGEPRPYRTGFVQPHPEPRLDEADPGLRAVKAELVTLAEGLIVEMADHFPLDPKHLAALAASDHFARLVNGIAARLDLPAERKLGLLDQSLTDRALDVLGVLRSRRRVLDLLRPFRHLARHPEQN